MLVVNPAATSTTPRVRDVLASALGSDLKVDVVNTTHRGHAADLGRQCAEEGLDVVAVLGGDGTINEVVNGLLHAGPRASLPALGIVPGGSTNVLARSLGIPGDPVEATGALLDALRVGRSRRISLGRANERWFTFTAGLGLDAAAVRAVEVARTRGRRSTPQLFARKALREFFASDRRHPPMTLTRPGEEPLTGLFLTVVSKTAPWTYLGTRPLVMTPTASFDLGLDIVALRRMRTVGTATSVLRTLSAKGIRGRNVIRLVDVEVATVSADSPQPFQVDGEYLGEHDSVAFRSVPGALELIC